MTNEEVYMQVCKSYFKDKTPKTEIAVTLKKPLLKYKHTLKNGFITFLTPMDAINEIINTEIESQYLAQFV